MTAPHDGSRPDPRARCGDLIVACTGSGQESAYEIGIVTHARDGLAQAWRTTAGAIRPARFVRQLRYRLLVPQDDIDVEMAFTAVSQRARPFASLAEVRAAMRPWLRDREHQMEAGS